MADERGRGQRGGGQRGAQQRGPGQQQQGGRWMQPVKGETEAENRAIAPSSHSSIPAPRTFNELIRWSMMFAEAGYFKDARTAAQAAVKIAAGAEYGFGPVASMSGIHIIEGNPTLHARMQASIVRRSARYDYRVQRHTDEVCIIEFYEIERGERVLIGTSQFDVEDADRAGLTKGENWKKYPRNMLFARALTNGIGWFCPDVLNGVPTYTPEELGRPDLEGPEGVILADALATEPGEIRDEPIEAVWRDADDPESPEAAHAGDSGAEGSEDVSAPAEEPVEPDAGDSGASDAEPDDGRRQFENAGDLARAAANELGLNTREVTEAIGQPLRFVDDLSAAWDTLVEAATAKAEKMGDDDA
jgi:hypothetical protein